MVLKDALLKYCSSCRTRDRETWFLIYPLKAKAVAIDKIDSPDPSPGKLLVHVGGLLPGKVEDTPGDPVPVPAHQDL